MNEEFIKPYLANVSEYDMLSGSNGSYTPLRYDLNYRNYYYVTEGSVSIKLTPPNSGKYLTKEKDFENLSFVHLLIRGMFRSSMKQNFQNYDLLK